MIVDGDVGYRRRIAHELQGLGFDASSVGSVDGALDIISESAPAYAVIDLQPGKTCGLDVVVALAKKRPSARSVVLTAYSSFTTAVLAIKLGAADYLTKPVAFDRLRDVLLDVSPKGLPEAPDVMSAPRVRWEHVHRVYELCDRNVSETARRLAMHRRTLQRMLSKHAPR